MTKQTEGAPREAATGVRAKPGKYLTFEVGQEVYGLEILKVQEIIGIMRVTRVPGTPSFIRGVINLRGKVIPLVDLRAKFVLPAKEDTERTCIIVVQVRRESQLLTMGIIVDEVKEVSVIGAAQLEPVPEFGGAIETGFLLGVGKSGSRFVMLLDVDHVLLGTEIASVAQAAGA
jgi:purine-binding chemotaxis protein CheW